MIKSGGSWVYGLTSAMLLFLLPLQANSQEFDSNAVHWAYSSYFGTGWYRLGDTGDAFVVRITPRFELRETSLQDGKRKIGIEFRSPVTIGMDTFPLDDPTGTLDASNLATLSITPGVEVIIPVNERWSLRPYASMGFGTVLNEIESAWSYWAGIKSKYTLASGKRDWSLLNSVGYVGFTPSSGTAEDFWPLMIGLEVEHDFGDVMLGDEQAILTWHATYTSFENNLDAVLENGTYKPISDQWEFAVSLRREDQHIRLWWFHFDRLGLAYRFSTNGDLQGVAVIIRSVFEG